MRKVRSHHLLPQSNSDDRTAKDGAAPEFGLAKLFQDPNLIGKLATNPRTQKHLADPTFVHKVCDQIK